MFEGLLPADTEKAVQVVALLGLRALAPGAGLGHGTPVVLFAMPFQTGLTGRQAYRLAKQS
jgi:hypothetical protein